MNCKACPTTLGPRNQSGYCRKCFSKCVPVSEETRAKRSAGIKARLQRDPELLAHVRKTALAATRSPAAVKARTEHCLRTRMWEKGNLAARAPEVRAKAAASTRATKLAWCPPHLREDYLDLIYRKKVRAPEARKLILEQEAREIARVRNRMGYVEPERPAMGRPQVWPDCPDHLRPQYDSLRNHYGYSFAEARKLLEASL